ncbi:uncharacterized protein LOC108670306, partial [Hyalella azteca]|uniref:Uncharacterized protein LOC108670306 n=1 Tax=Hyalella azteca TaxID=294128 RepID=A0A8B7NHY8_HYAAZ
MFRRIKKEQPTTSINFSIDQVINQEDEIDEFLPKPHSSSHLSSIFDDPPIAQLASSRTSLNYVPPRQPNEASSAATDSLSGAGLSNPGVTDSNPVLLAVKVEVTLIHNSTDRNEQIGAVVSCVLSPKQNNSPCVWLLYQNPKNPIAKILVDKTLQLSVISHDSLQVFDALRQKWWLLKTAPEQLVLLLLQVYICKSIAGSDSTAVELLSPSLAGTSGFTALQVNDWTEVCLRNIAVGPTGRIRQSYSNGGEKQRLRVAA